jgi:hypothetical protein
MLPRAGSGFEGDKHVAQLTASLASRYRGTQHQLGRARIARASSDPAQPVAPATRTEIRSSIVIAVLRE